MGKKQKPSIAPMTPRVLNVEGTAAYLGVGVSKLNDMRNLGVFSVPTLPYGAYYDVRRVDEWLDTIGGVDNLEETYRDAWLGAVDG